MFAEEFSLRQGVDWDFGGLATQRHKQAVSPVAVIISSPL